MKILFLNSLADPAAGGGAEQTLWTLMRGMRDAGHQCVLLATSDQPGLHRHEQDGITVWLAGIRNLYWPYHKRRPPTLLRLLWHVQDSYNPWMQGYIRDVVAQECPDVVSLHNLPGWSAAAWKTLHELGLPTVQVLHDYYSICIKTTMFSGGKNCAGQCRSCAAFRLAHRTMSRNLSAVVGVSRFMLETHKRLGYFEGVPIQRVIHNAREPKALGLGSANNVTAHEGIRFGYIGRLHQSKGIEPLLSAFLHADIPNSELWIAGSGKHDYEQYLHTKVRDPRVRMLGRVKPAEFYPQVDVVVVPSIWNEPLGMVVPEALAYGKPVIGSHRGGIPEIIVDGENGLLFEPDAPGELKAALEALTDDALRAWLTEQARPSARPFVDMAGWIDTYEALYRELVPVAGSAPSPQASS